MTSSEVKTENRSALALGFASPIVGLTLSLLIGLAVSDIFGTLDIWMGVIIIALIGASLVIGAHFSALAHSDVHGSKGAAKAASVLNLVIVSIWSYVTYGVSVSGGIASIMALQSWKNNGGYVLRSFNSDDLWNHLLPAVVMHLTLLVVLYFFVTLRSKGRKL